ncbi:MAG TPA: phage holin family protein [Candidatus Baltobacteraceae bacterium]|nr:phage holin family protein [Candidatus Baltobacteraceae bacterium]
MHFLIRLLINGIAFYLIARYVPGIHANGFGYAVLAAFIFGIVNAIVRPIVLLLTLPFTIITLGLFIIVVNALMFWLATWISPGFKVDGFVPALIGGIIMAIVGMITNAVFKEQADRAPAKT